MAITFVGSHVGTHAATTAQTVAFSNLKDASGATPTVLEGDIVLVAVENASTVNRSTAGGADVLVPSGYTGIATHNYQGDSNDSNFRVSRKRMGVTPDTSVAIPASNATTAGVAYAIYVFRGVSPTPPIDGSPASTGGINTGIANAPAVNPVTPGAWIVVFGGAAVAAGAVFTNPAGMSATTNHFRSATITTTTNDANIAGAIYTGWTSGAYDPAVFGGSTSTNTGSWSAVTIALRPVVEHDATGDLISDGSSVDGTAAHSVTHGSSGALAGDGSEVVGSADRASGTVSHDTTGALSGQGAAVAGSASHTRLHATTGALAGQGSSLSATATRFRAHTFTGVLQGQGSTVSGSASRTRAHASTGALAGAGSTLSGTARHNVPHGTTGALSGDGSSIAGSASRSTGAVTHGTSGTLTGQGSALAGAAARTRQHAASGVLAGSVSAVDGSASRIGAPVSHDVSGALAGQGSNMTGTATNGAPPPSLSSRFIQSFVSSFAA